MESAAIQNQQLNRNIRAAELTSLLNKLPPQIKVISLDCFDTILWRKTATPHDVFYNLQEKTAFKSLGITARLRKQAEATAREKMKFQLGHSEVTLKDIYQNFALSEAQLNALIEEELTEEIETCYAFPSIINFIRAAYARKLKIIIISDTYFTESQLKKLLENNLPLDVVQMISNIFCSCELGNSKSAGVFKSILATLNATPSSTLHIGDNKIADHAAPIALGINALHLIHHHDNINETMRMQALSSSFIDPSIRNSRALTLPFRAILASDTHSASAEHAIGYATLGPIMYAFANFINHQVEKIKLTHPSAKVIFLLRDAHLPFLACEGLTGHTFGKCVRISRFTAFAASFRTKEDVDSYLAERIKSEHFKEMCKQLLLPDNIIRTILEKTDKSKEPINEFTQQIHKKQILETIFFESAKYRKRLKQYLEKEIDLKGGDTLVFVDLGYTGTAQIKLAPVFKEEFGVNIMGVYLLSLPIQQTNINKVGLLDISSYDDNALIMLITYIALLEQICTTNEKSVIDFDEKGKPIYSDTELSEQQYNKLKILQSECLRFIHDTKKFLETTHIKLSEQMLKDAAAINLCRLLFLPIKDELDYLKSFEFDFNLGTDKVLNIFDLNKGLTGLRRRSWLHCSKENIKHMRTNYPAEWRSASIELALTLMAQHRFGLEFALNDLSHRREKLQIMALHGNETFTLDLEAMPTHDGYFSLLVPITDTQSHIGVRFGANYRWIELESAELIKLKALYSKREIDYTTDASSQLGVDQMLDKGGGLFECTSAESLLAFSPDKNLEAGNHVLRIIFRPIVKNESLC